MQVEIQDKVAHAIREICQKELGITVDSVNELGHGVFKTAYDVGNDLVFLLQKSGAKDLEAENTKFFFEKLKEAKIKAPTIYATGTINGGELDGLQYMIETKVLGRTLEDFMGPTEDTILDYSILEEALENVGAYLRQVHKIKGKGFGPIIYGEGRYAVTPELTFRRLEDYEKAFDKAIALLRYQGILDENDEDNFINTLLDNRIFLYCRDPRLLHRDFHPGNIVLNPKTLEITGLIDPASAFGDPYEDIADMMLTVSIQDYDDFLHPLLNGYRQGPAKSGEKKVRTYHLLKYLIYLSESCENEEEELSSDDKVYLNDILHRIEHDLNTV